MKRNETMFRTFATGHCAVVLYSKASKATREETYYFEGDFNEKTMREYFKFNYAETVVDYDVYNDGERMYGLSIADFLKYAKPLTGSNVGLVTKTLNFSTFGVYSVRPDDITADATGKRIVGVGYEEYDATNYNDMVAQFKADPLTHNNDIIIKVDIIEAHKGTYAMPIREFISRADIVK